MSTKMNVVLVHGAWADGSCWSGVIKRLQTRDYKVTAPQFPETSLADDVARLRQVLTLQDGPTIVVAHSYGGQIMTRSAPMPRMWWAWSTSPPSGSTRANPSVPCSWRASDRGPRSPVRRRHGFAWLPEDDFVNHFAADVAPAQARVMHAVQQPLSMSTFGDVMGAPAWKSLPSWYMVAADDEAIPPDAERSFAERWGPPPSSSRAVTSRWSPTLTTSYRSSRQR